MAVGDILLGQLLLALQIILSKVAALAEAVGVVRPVGMLACAGHARLAFAVVAAVTHVLGIVLLVQMVAQKVVLHIDRGTFAEHAHDLPPLEKSDLVLAELAYYLGIVDSGVKGGLLVDRRRLAHVFGLGLRRGHIGLDVSEQALLQFKKLDDLRVSACLEGLQLLELGRRGLNVLLEHH